MGGSPGTRQRDAETPGTNASSGHGGQELSEFHASVLRSANTYGDPYERDDPRSPSGEYAVMRDRTVWFTPSMMLICGAFLAWEFSLNDWEAAPLDENPSFGPGMDVLLDAGAKRTDLIVDEGEWWRLITAMFLHAGVVHYLFNMIGFMNIGYMVEAVFGGWKVAAIYLTAGLFGTITSAIFVPHQLMVGASGAIFGVFGALWADLWQNWGIHADRCCAVTVLFILTAINIILGLMPFLDNFAHLGGLLMGFLMGLILLVQKRENDLGDRVGKKCYQMTLQGFAALVVPALFLVSLVLLYEKVDSDDWCSWCDKISCIEFPAGDPWWRCDECTTGGFQAEYFSNGTVVFTCPDLSSVTTTACLGSTLDELTDCCVDVCLT